MCFQDGQHNFSVQGDIVKIGTGSTTQGELCYYKSDGAWAAADADAASTSGGCLLAIALGTDPDVDGMLASRYVHFRSRPRHYR
ncbi:MAG: hypothetical protein CM15mV74_210 [uncultured marine virus]|nr:MAG: hypothetical protein CM15mV74_210 [uncultured marine virus]